MGNLQDACPYKVLGRKRMDGAFQHDTPYKWNRALYGQVALSGMRLVFPDKVSFKSMKKFWLFF